MNKDEKGKVLYVGTRRSGRITTFIPTDVKFVRLEEIHFNKDETIKKHIKRKIKKRK